MRVLPYSLERERTRRNSLTKTGSTLCISHVRPQHRNASRSSSAQRRVIARPTVMVFSRYMQHALLAR